MAVTEQSEPSAEIYPRGPQPWKQSPLHLRTREVWYLQRKKNESDVATAQRSGWVVVNCGSVCYRDAIDPRAHDTSSNCIRRETRRECRVKLHVEYNPLEAAGCCAVCAFARNLLPSFFRCLVLIRCGNVGARGRSFILSSGLDVSCSIGHGVRLTGSTLSPLQS